MPAVPPDGGAVAWPAGEGTIGVVGVAPWATIDFLKALYAQVAASKDWHYPRVLCDINTKLPSRGRHLELGERDPSPYIAATIDELADQGATLVVVPCNTAHILYERWSRDARVPVPNIIEACVAAIGSSGGRRAAVFASASLRRHGIFSRAIRDAGMEAIELDPRQGEVVDHAIAAVKQSGGIPTAIRQQIGLLLADLAERQGVDSLILGCTELAGLEALARTSLHHVAESNHALANAALRGIGMQPVPASEAVGTPPG